MDNVRRWGGRHAQALTRATLATWGDCCHLCGRQGATTADHLVPRNHGGADALVNLRPAHGACNYGRGAKPLPPRRLAQLLAATTRDRYQQLVARPPRPDTDGLAFID